MIVAVPSQFARAVHRELASILDTGTPVVLASKGIEEDSLKLPLEVARDELGAGWPAAVLSGPSFARELAEGRATAVSLAGDDEALVQALQQALSTGVLRLYSNPDPVGVQLAGALKNVIAIAAGAADSLGMGTNARAALITRGLAEMARLGVSLGGRPETFSGLAGMGDLVLTCTDDLSRNRAVGQRVGRGERMREILSSSPAVAEGVRTTRSARALARRQGIEMPIVEEVHRVLFEDGVPQQALERLLRRPLRSEREPVEPDA